MMIGKRPLLVFQAVSLKMLTFQNTDLFSI